MLPTLEQSDNSGKSDNKRNIGVKEDPRGEEQDAAGAENRRTDPVDVTVDTEPMNSQAGAPSFCPLTSAAGGRRCSKQQRQHKKKLIKPKNHTLASYYLTCNQTHTWGRDSFFFFF